MKETLSQYSPKSTYLQNENNLITASRNLIGSLENGILFLKKEMEIKKPAHFYSNLNATVNAKSISSERSKPWVKWNVKCEELNEKNKIGRKNVVHNFASQKTYTVIPYSSITENTIQCNNTQNIKKKTNTQNGTTNTINLNPSNNRKCELVREDTSNAKSNPSIQQKRIMHSS